MDQLYNILNLLYSRFLLRDFFGKIIPGFIVIFVGTFILFSPDSSVSRVLNFSFWGWLLFIGVAWITGFVVQSFGHLIHLINYVHRGEKDKISNETKKIKRIFIYISRFFQWSTPDEKQQRKQKYEADLQFFQYATADEKQQRERTVVIKEAAGNGCVTLLICLFFLLLALLNDYFPNKNWILNYCWQKLLVFILVIISGGLLYRLYRQSEIDQYDYQEQVLKHHEIKNQDQLNLKYKVIKDN